MQVITDEDVDGTIHAYYDELIRKQLVINLEAGESLVVTVLGTSNETLFTKTYKQQYTNCHFNLQWQDKGIKKKAP